MPDKDEQGRDGYFVEATEEDMKEALIELADITKWMEQNDDEARRLFRGGAGIIALNLKKLVSAYPEFVIFTMKDLLGTGFAAAYILGMWRGKKEGYELAKLDKTFGGG